MMTRSAPDLWRFAKLSIDCSHRTVGLSTTCDSHDLTLHTTLSDGVVTVRP